MMPSYKAMGRSSDFSEMSAKMSREQMQAKIAAARRDADALKDKIKRKKDELVEDSPKLQRRFNTRTWATKS